MAGLAAGAFGGVETFDSGRTGLSGTSTTWKSGSFTNEEEGVAWEYEHGRGSPQMVPGDGVLVLQTTSKGWLRSGTMTGGVGRVEMDVMQGGGTNAVDFDLWTGTNWVGNFKGCGVSGRVEHAVFAVVEDAERRPVTGEWTLMVSNRVTKAGVLVLDNLAWEPFRLHVRLPVSGTVEVRAGSEWDVEAEVTAGEGVRVTGGTWVIPEDFHGDYDHEALAQTQLTLTPSRADEGHTYELVYRAEGVIEPESGGGEGEEGGEGGGEEGGEEGGVEGGGEGEGGEGGEEEGGGEEPEPVVVAAEARVTIYVSEKLDARVVDFEDMGNVNYGTNQAVQLKGWTWLLTNVRHSDAADVKIGTRSARFHHASSNSPAVFESRDPFPGVGTVSLRAACFQTDRDITLALQAHGEEEEWQTLEWGECGVKGHLALEDGFFWADVNRSDDVWIRIVSLGKVGQYADVDEIEIREFGETLPRTVCVEQEAMERLGGTRTFEVLNREGPFEWSWDSAPAGTVEWEETEESRLVAHLPEEDASRGTYELEVEIAPPEGEELPVGLTLATNVTVKVVRAPSFELTATENVTVSNPVDVVVANVSLNNATSTVWTTAWSVEPLFESNVTLSHKSRFRLGKTCDGDAGIHRIQAVLRDAETGLTTTNEVYVTVRVESPGPGPEPELDSRDFVVKEFSGGKLTLRVEYEGRVTLQPFAAESVEGAGTAEGRVWEGEAVVFEGPGDVEFDVEEAGAVRVYGVKVTAAGE